MHLNVDFSVIHLFLTLIYNMYLLWFRRDPIVESFPLKNGSATNFVTCNGHPSKGWSCSLWLSMQYHEGNSKANSLDREYKSSYTHLYNAFLYTYSFNSILWENLDWLKIWLFKQCRLHAFIWLVRCRLHACVLEYKI